MLLSVVIPVYNEAPTLREIISLVQKVSLSGIEREIVLVDDFSEDGSREILRELEGGYTADPQAPPLDRPIKTFFHAHNQGKGAALRTGFAHTSGDLVLIQDADLEYDPNDYPALLAPLLEGRTKAVYGSRFLGQRENMAFLNGLGNRVLTLAGNLINGTSLTDLETCYKAFEGDLIRSIKITVDRFNIEPEITAKVIKKGVRIIEVPISYNGRDAEAGKKITWRDAISCLATIVKFRFKD